MDEYKKFVNRFFSPFGPFEIKASSKEGGAVEKLRSETKAFLDQLGTSIYYVINCQKGDWGLLTFCTFIIKFGYNSGQKST